MTSGGHPAASQQTIPQKMSPQFVPVDLAPCHCHPSTHMQTCLLPLNPLHP